MSNDSVNNIYNIMRIDARRTLLIGKKIIIVVERMLMTTRTFDLEMQVESPQALSANTTPSTSHTVALRLYKDRSRWTDIPPTGANLLVYATYCMLFFVVQLDIVYSWLINYGEVDASESSCCTHWFYFTLVGTPVPQFIEEETKVLLRLIALCDAEPNFWGIVPNPWDIVAYSLYQFAPSFHVCIS